LTAFVVPVHDQLVPHPIRSPCWHVDQIVFEPEPEEAPHQLLLTQYLPSVMNAFRVAVEFALAAGEHVTLLGSRHAPKRHCVAPVHVVPHVPQFCGSENTALQTPLQGTWSVGHWHTPLTQVAPVAHALPHIPQFTVLAVMSLHDPPQSPWPFGHLQALWKQV
jgi:hypothetical protein